MSAQIPIDQAKLADFCRRHHIRKLALFGSVLREDFRPDSDVDVLYSFEEGYSVGYFELCALEEELSAILGGRKVDLVPASDLNRWIKARVIREAEVQYVKG